MIVGPSRALNPDLKHRSICSMMGSASPVKLQQILVAAYSSCIKTAARWLPTQRTLW